MPNNIAGSMLVSVLNPDGTLVGQGGGPEAQVEVTNFPATQPVSGSVTVSGTVTANVGTGTQAVSGTVTANAGTGTFNIASGTAAFTSLNAVTGAATGTVADFTTAKTNMSIIAVSTGTLAGDIEVFISHNNTLFGSIGTQPITAGGTLAFSSPCGARYVRVNFSTPTGTGTITATVMGA